MLVKLFSGSESDAIYSLQAVISSFSEPVSRCVLHDLEGLDSAGVRHVRPRAEIYQVTIPVSSHFASLRYFAFYELPLEWVVAKKS